MQHGLTEDSVFGELNGSLGFANLAAVVNYKKRDGGRANDDLDHFLGLEGLVGVDLAVAQTEAFKRYGGELRLTSNDGGPLSWLVGADYQHSTSDVVTANSGTVPVTSAAALKAQAVRRDTSSETLQSYSAFGLLEYKITPQLSVSGEIRYQRDQKDFVFQRIDTVTGAIVTASPSGSEVLPTATVTYKPSSTQTIYARYATGFRPFGFNLGVANLAQLQYGRERAQSFELGWKGRIPALKLRFDVAGYYNISDNTQVATAASATDTTITLQNIPGAKNWGGEAQISGLIPIADGKLTYSVGLATQDGRYDTGSRVIVAGQTVVIGDTRTNRSRDITANVSAFYSIPVGHGLTLVSGGSVRREAGGNENVVGGTTNAAGRKLDNFTLVDARMTLKGQGWQVSAFGKNIFDQSFVVQSINGNNYYNERARYGVALSINLGGERR
jgi:iron complex outermembrane recepter protein